MRWRSAMNASTREPARTFVDGFAGEPSTTTWPPSHRRVASGRVFTRRTAQSQRSMRVSAGVGESTTWTRVARLGGADTHHQGGFSVVAKRAQMSLPNVADPFTRRGQEPLIVRVVHNGQAGLKR